MRKILSLALILAAAASCAPNREPAKPKTPPPEVEAAKATTDAAALREAIANQKKPADMSDEDWKKKLNDQQYWVCRQKGTERPFTGALLHNKKKGSYICVACGHELFRSETKFESGTGWPSFWDPAGSKSLKTESDTTYGMVRTEVMCRNCGSHLGHVFDDGPKPTGMRYCINSVALKFVEDKGETEKAPEEKK